MIKIPNVNYEIQDDRVLLEQDEGSGEINQIELHRMHLEHIASEFGMPSLSNTAESILKKLQLVTRRLIDISANEYYRTEIVERCGSGAEFFIELDGLCDLASELLNGISSDVAVNISNN